MRPFAGCLPPAALTFLRGLIARGLAQSAAKWPRPVKPLASGEPRGPKLDEIGKHTSSMEPSLLFLVCHF